MSVGIGTAASSSIGSRGSIPPTRLFLLLLLLLLLFVEEFQLSIQLCLTLLQNHFGMLKFSLTFLTGFLEEIGLSRVGILGA